MNRHLRNFLFFLSGWLLVAVPILAMAETIAASGPTTTSTTLMYYLFTTDISSATPAGAAQVGYASIGVPPGYTKSGPFSNSSCTSASFGPSSTVYYKRTDTSTGSTACPTAGAINSRQDCLVGTYSGGHCVGVYTCPSNQNWTLSGSSCTRPDCVAPEMRDPSNGVCVAPVCPTTSTTSWYRRGKSQDISGSYCINNCSYSLALDLSAPEFYESSSYYWMQYSMSGSGTSCSTNSSNVPSGSSTAPNQPPKDSPCGAGEGVISNSAGKVQCVPGGTNSGADTPKVDKKTTTDTKPDGSQVITNTTTTCTGAGACSTSTTVTITNNSSGQPGQAGTPGTSSSSSDKTPTETPDFCKSAPNSQICKGGIATEATVEKINVNTKATVDELKKLTEPAVSDASAIENQTFSNTTGRQELTDKDNELKNYVNGTTTDGGVAGSKSAWEAAMSSGWWEPITLNGCAPFVMNFSGHTFTIDHCEKAAQISQLGAYALWVVLLISTFVMLTGGRKS